MSSVQIDRTVGWLKIFLEPAAQGRSSARATPRNESDRRLVEMQCWCRVRATPNNESDRRLVEMQCWCRVRATPNNESDRLGQDFS